MAKFALPMKNGVAVSKMAELREHFDLKEAIKYLGNGRLMKWLRDREDYDEEADKLDTLIDECKGNHLELAKRLCTILNVEFDETKFNAEELDGLNELSQKAEKLGQYTSDSAILTSADRCAFDQAELDKLVEDDKLEIYLCNGEFTIPLVKKKKCYYGFGNAIAKIPSNEYVDFEELGIQFDKEKYKVKFDEDYAKIDQAGTIEQQKETYYRNAQDAYDEEDYAKAIEEFRKAANMGYVKAMTKLGRLYYEKKAGEAIEASEAVKWLERAVAEHDTDAMQLLSDMYFNGQGVEKNEEQAFCYLKDAVEGAEEPSKENLYALGHMYRLGLGTVENREKAQDYLKKAAEMGNSCAMNELGIMYQNGDSIVSEDSRLAGEWFQKAARAGNANGMFHLGLLYLEGDGVNKDEKTAFNLIKDAAEANNAEAMNCLGCLYEDGAGVAKDEAQAVKWYRMAADAGETLGMVNLGCCYMKGIGVEQDYTEGAKCFRMAADKEDPDGMYKLGNAYLDGLGVEQDYVEAAKWFKGASDKGNADSMYQIGFLYMLGNGVAKDEKLALKWFDKAADAGCSDAMNRLGEMCSDKYQIQNWYQKSANAGNALGMERLGDCFNQGGYYQKAKEWYEKAAKLGRGEAAHKIAKYYEKGYGVKKNQEVANHWIKEAEKLGYTSILDSKAVKAADAVAESFVPGYKLVKKAFSIFD